MIDRRVFVMGAGAAIGVAVVAEARTEPGSPVFESGPLARNTVARSFLTVPSDVRLPQIGLSSNGGTRRLDQLSGKVRIVSLWAEWCLPCLLEAVDLSVLRHRFAGSGFDILAILTAGRAGFDQAQAQAKLVRLGAAHLPTWVEPSNGRKVGEALAGTDPPYVSLPCNLLIDRDGRVRGRSIGNGLGRAAGGRSHWATDDAARFVGALAEGALDRIAKA